jgi:crossover junction endodeoxyribonuclease RuvC
VLKPKGIRRIVGIDPGSVHAGVACVDVLKDGFSFNNVKVVDILTINLQKNLDLNLRVGYLHKGIYELLSSYKPDVCVLEKCFVGLNSQSALKLGVVRGACIAACARIDLHVNEVYPTQVKKIISGNGSASKEELRRSLEVLLSYSLKNHSLDASDALAIALSYYLNRTKD